ncbi:MAG: hypothetical protein K8H88_17640 [Sandaracinaceae bacterium]|nr:hypothetical protein [Sandaracinaceae bacterium]
MVAALHGLALRPPASGLHERQMSLARLLDVIANLDMELGQPLLSIDAAGRAHALYRSLGHPAGVVHALQVAAHAHGQLEQVRRAADLAARAHVLCDADRALRRGWRRALLVGVRGQRESKLGRYALAERRLEQAQRACEEAGVDQWAAIWAGRRAENAIAARQLWMAERHLDRAHELGRDPRTTVPHRAATVRITAHFLALTRPSEAIAWAREGQRIGVEKGMANQLRLMRPIFDLLGMEPGID